MLFVKLRKFFSIPLFFFPDTFYLNGCWFCQVLFFALTDDYLGLPWWSSGKESPSNAGDMGSIPGWGTKSPHATGQLSPCTTTTELARFSERACVLQTTEPMCPGACMPQLERSLHHNKRSGTSQRRPHMRQLRPDAAKRIKKINK